jgi:Lanthionine synthetase C-like protein
MPLVLHDPVRHEPLTDQEWDEKRVAAAVARVVADADEAYGEAAGHWPLHELDSGDEDDDWAGVAYGVYLGAAGMLWALDRLTGAGLASTAIDLPAAAARLHERYRARCHAPDEPMPGIWSGEAGVLLVAELLVPDAARAENLLAVVRSNPRNPTRDVFWGAPGTMLAASEMLARTGDSRWADAWRESAEAVLASWEADDEVGCRLWTQVIDERSTRYLGAAHGFAGNVASLLQGLDLLPDPIRNEIVVSATRTVVATPSVEDGRANWPVSAGGVLDGPQGVRTQWCHGAPGMISSIAGLPADPELEAILLAGGELTWHAGPLAKGAGLCHGTAGNGLAFLALFARTGDDVWLSRARAFAMHALEQVDRQRQRYGAGRFGLWTGDIGAALYATQCIAGDPAVPALTAW